MSDNDESREAHTHYRGSVVARLRDWVTGLRGAKAYGFAVVTGVFSNLAFAPTYIWPALAVGLVSLIWLLDGAVTCRKPRAAAFWRSFAFASGLFLFGFHWLGFAFLVNSSQHLAFIWLAALLPLFIAFIWAVFLRLMMNLWSPGPARVLLFAITVFAAELVRGHLFGGFPWNIPAMIWTPGAAVSQIASVVGVWGLSLLTLVLLASPAAIEDSRPGLGATGGALGRVSPVLASALVFGLIWGWGSHRLHLSDTTGTGQMLRLVDAGPAQGEKFAQEVRPLVLRRYLELTGADSANSPSIVIWPEGAVPYWLLQQPDALEPVTAQLGARRLIVGTSFFDNTGVNERAYNTLSVLSRDSSYAGAMAIYYKHRLVPFGEMVPFRKLAARIGISTLQEIASAGFHAGPPPSAVSVEGMPDFQPLICYEALFPGLLPKRSVESVDDVLGLETRPEWIVNISIDSWFGPVLGPIQHMEHAKYRSIEEGLPMARVASRGRTGVIDAYGRQTATAIAPESASFSADREGWRARIVDAELPRALEPTVYGKHRWLMVLLVLALVAAGTASLPRN